MGFPPIRSAVHFVHTAGEEEEICEPALDCLTSPGHMNGGNGRREVGLHEGGPTVVITNMAVAPPTAYELKILRKK